jgi:hypothetical protein
VLFRSNWVACRTGSWLDLSATNGALAAAGSTNILATLNAGALVAGIYDDTLTFSNATSGIGYQARQVRLRVRPHDVYCFALDSDPGWPREGQWAFGRPTGSGGTSYGGPDPANGATGANVFGVNLAGDYSTSAGGPCYLTVGPLNFTSYTNVILQFKRWLNSDFQPFVYATIDVSSNGNEWTPVFSNGTGEITDSVWTGFQYDISPTAAGNADVYVRWGYQINSLAYAYSGWNIDDIEFLRLPLCAPRLGVALSGTSLVINSTNGTPGETYYVLASTNLTTPWTNWFVLATNSFDMNGGSGFTNGLGTNSPRCFFRLESP